MVNLVSKLLFLSCFTAAAATDEELFSGPITSNEFLANLVTSGTEETVTFSLLQNDVICLRSFIFETTLTDTDTVEVLDGMGNTICESFTVNITTF